MHKGVPFSFLSFFLSLLFLSNTRKIRATRAREFTSVGSNVLNATIFARVSTVSLIKAFLRGAWNLDLLLISFFFVGATKEPHKFFLLLLRWRKHQSVVGVLFFAVLPAGASPCPFQEELTKQSHIREQTNAGVYQHHRRVDYFVRHASSLDGAKDVPKSRYKRR